MSKHPFKILCRDQISNNLLDALAADLIHQDHLTHPEGGPRAPFSCPLVCFRQRLHMVTRDEAGDPALSTFPGHNDIRRIIIGGPLPRYPTFCLDPQAIAALFLHLSLIQVAPI